MRFVLAFILVFFCSSSALFSQQITTDSSVNLQSLIENNFANGCIEISNITSSVNGNSSGFPSYAYFERGTSSFPFNNGIMLSTGSTNSGGNSIITNILNEGDSSWGTDSDLEAALGVTNTLNATSIEFDFISSSSQFYFNFLYASEEYFDQLPCFLTDHIVFLITEKNSGNPYRNIAVIPGTNTPVNSRNIHSEIFGVCAATNEQYFDGYNFGDTNYDGRTEILTASETITPNVEYHVKLIIADSGVPDGDSAVFIEGNSYDPLDLGDNITTCSSSARLDADINNPLATYQWFKYDEVNSVWDIIAGETNTFLNVSENGDYRVVVTVPLGNSNCDEQDEITIVLNSEETVTPINDYEICDVPGGNGSQFFDLSTRDTELIINIGALFSSYTFRYYTSDSDARNNPNNSITSITSSGQEIWVRIDDTNSNCVAYTSFNLVVTPTPTIAPFLPMTVCDGDDQPNNGFTAMNLTVKDDEITGGNPNLVVSYHFNNLDALNGENEIPNGDYVNSNPYNDQVYIRVLDVTTGCFNTDILPVEVTDSPLIVFDTQYLDACDTSHVGVGTFDLTEKIDAILNGLPLPYTVTYHTSRQDAENGTDPILHPENYDYSSDNREPGYTTIFVRVVDGNTGCPSIGQIETHTSLLLTGPGMGDFAECDNNEDSNDALDFDLLAIEREINEDLTDWVEVTFYSDEDRNNLLPKSTPFSAVNGTTLYLNLRDTVSGCEDSAEITLIINPILNIQHTGAIEYCDDNGTGFMSVVLEDLDAQITGGNSNFSVTYFTSESDANNGALNVLPPIYDTSTTVLWARIQSNENPQCYTVNRFDLIITTAPSVTDANTIEICSNQNSEEINLRDNLNEMISDTTGVVISYYNSLEDANAPRNPIEDPDSYTVNSSHTIFVRFDSSATGCHSIAQYDIIFNTKPILPNDLKLQVCEPAGISTSNFILSEMNGTILNSQSGKIVLYYEDENDAINRTPNAELPTNGYPSGNRTIYVRVENITDTDCNTIAPLELEVSPEALYNPVVGFSVCDNFNDRSEEIDLAAKRAEISNGYSNLTISFHATRNNARDNISPLPNEHSITQNETIFVRIESSDSPCYEIEEFSVNLFLTPDVSEVSGPLIECDEDYDEITNFNLLEADFDISGRLDPSLYLVYYYEEYEDINQDNGLDHSNAIDSTLLTQFPSENGNTVFIKVTDPGTGCFTIISQDLIVNTPPIFNTISSYSTCESNSNTFDLSEINSTLVNEPSLVNINYATTSAAIISNNVFTYTIPGDYVVDAIITDINNSCSISTSFTLSINPNPTAFDTPNLYYCDSNIDTTDTETFNLLDTEALIRGASQPDSQFSLTFYNDSDNAYSEDGSGAIGNVYQALHEEIIYARIENRITGCFDVTTFETHINPRPVIPIETVVPLCNDVPIVVSAETGFSGDMYSWSTGSSSSEILVQPSDLINGSINLSVTVTRPYLTGDCSNTHSFTVMASEDAGIIFTPTVNFNDPNSITVNLDMPNRIGDYIFLLDGVENSPRTYNVFENVTYGEHLVTVRDLNGCNDVTKSVFVFDIPKFFTPNNDGPNDTWHIVGIERPELRGSFVNIYNRHGKLIKTLTHTSIGWDGTYNGNPMPSDDYWYVAKVSNNGILTSYKGHFALKR
ncbi:T9SS type B sorting domain-containing protein [Seonamhaeicola marinus]|nr:T9SS type B sorting domain-containing protein [Seonamhaeicola marinus]